MALDEDHRNEWHTKAMAAKTLEEKVQAAVLAARNIKEKVLLGCIGPTQPIYGESNASKIILRGSIPIATNTIEPFFCQA